ncbi:hypothetical protein PGSY75_1459600 [Plasmodium gaboni]|uniref:ENTH domain-containing protein n=1 Tax=Plasmodium gaboni TaxID=647221 RepID=A0A151LBC0_9APIC|nr:hypothetical protein PGSY75_1459600 [Plasmodium gaboni]KYN96187.1 hypothetical protein PGSY75_1459600 [Plasmodium gaboni]
MMNRLILNKATSSNDEPTPGYLFNEITQMTFCSKESLGLVGEYLLKKLQRTDLNVKLKTLKIMKHLCDKKRGDFRNFLKKKMDIIKECQQCNIVNDELKGETPSMLVRKEATDLIKLIYSYDATENVMKSSSNNSQDTMKNNRIEGFGNTVFDNKNNQPNQHNNQHNNIYNHSNNNNIYNNNDRNLKNNMETYGNKFISNNYNNKNNYMSKMSGFGNPYFNQNPVQKTKGEIAIKYLNDVANKYIPSSFVNKINRVSASLSKNYSNGSLNIHSIMNGRAFNKGLEKNHIKRSESYYHNKNNINSINSINNINNINSINSMHYMNNHHNNNSYNNNYYNNSRRNDNVRKPQEIQQAGLYENKIIQDILLTTGINKVPSENILNEFAIKCKTLDTKLIVSILTDKLKKNIHDEEENCKYKYKVLSIIKHLLFFRTNEEKETLMETLEVLIQNLKNQTLEELYKCKEIKQLKKIVIEIFVLMGLQKKTDTQENEKNKNFNIYQNQASMEIPNLLDIDDDIKPPPNNNNNKMTMGDSKIFYNEKNKSHDLMSLSQNISNGTQTKNNKTGFDNNEHFKNQWNNKKDENMENLLCDFENISINNKELFNSLNVKDNNTQISYNNMRSNQNTDKTYYNTQQGNNKNNMNNNYNNNDKFNFMNSNNDLIFFENKKENNTKEINISSKQTNQTKLNDEGLFFHLNQQNIYQDENKLIDINNDTTNNSLNTYFNNISQNTYEKDNITNATSLNNNIKTSSNISHDNKTSNINYFHDHHLKMGDDQIDNFFNSFTLSSKKNEQNNTKPNVKIDAFELLSDQMKL